LIPVGRPTISGEEASNRRDRVVAAAVRLFAARGVAGTSMRRIAQAVGITDATLYHYFPSKDALIEAAFRSASFQVDDLEAAFEGTAGSLRERLLAVGEAFLAVLARDKQWTRLVVRESLRLPEAATGGDIASLLDALGRRRIESLAQALGRDAAAGLVRKCDGELVAAHFFHACVGFWISEALIAQQEPSPERRAAFLDHLVDLVASRLAAPPEGERP
jgi:AcrR family transcriptional regulator